MDVFHIGTVHSPSLTMTCLDLCTMYTWIYLEKALRVLFGLPVLKQRMSLHWNVGAQLQWEALIFLCVFVRYTEYFLEAVGLCRGQGFVQLLWMQRSMCHLWIFPTGRTCVTKIIWVLDLTCITSMELTDTREKGMSFELCTAHR